MAWKIGGKLGVGLILVKERVLKKGGKQIRVKFASGSRISVIME